jgi:hypothetical protein
LRNNLEQLSPIEAAVLTFLQQQLHNANQGEPTKSLLKRRPKALAAGRRATLSKLRSQHPTGDLKL